MRIVFAIIILLLLGLPVFLAAGSEYSGIEPGNEILAGANKAEITGGIAARYNPASLFLSGAGSFNLYFYLPSSEKGGRKSIFSSSYFLAAYGRQLNEKSSIGGAFTSIIENGLDGRNEQGEKTGVFNMVEDILDLSYCYAINNKLAVGLKGSMKYIKIMEYKDFSLHASLAVVFSPGSKLHTAFIIDNLLNTRGSLDAQDYRSLPEFTLSFAVTPAEKLTLGFTPSYSLDGHLELDLGTAIKIADPFELFVTYKNYNSFQQLAVENKNSIDSNYATRIVLFREIGLGFTLSHKFYALDYMFILHKDLGISHSIGFLLIKSAT